MTQPAKSQEPSMEEILASIRRIIADDDASRIAKRTSDAVAPEAVEGHEAFGQPAEPSSFVAPVEPAEPAVPQSHEETAAGFGMPSEAEEDHASEILDLTESMTARMFSEPERGPAPSLAPPDLESDASSEFREPEPMAQFYERAAKTEPEPAPQFHEPEPGPPLREPEPEPALQFHEPEPELAPQIHEPEPELEFHQPQPELQMPELEPVLQARVTENYADARVEEAPEELATPPRPNERSARYAPPESEPHGAGARPAPERGPLLSSATVAAVDSAFNALAHTVLVQNARTLEDLVREMLRPMLKTWLDDNLPGMVERLVRAEIERVARGR